MKTMRKSENVWGRVQTAMPGVNRRSGGVLAVLAAFLVVVTGTEAANTWDGGGSDDNWGTATNWDNDTVPAFPVAITFAGSTRLTPNNEAAAGTRTVNAITFSTTAGAFNLKGNSITLGGNITNLSSTVWQTNSMDMIISSTRTVTGTGGAVTVLSGNISGTGGLALSRIAGSGAHTVTLSGSNSYSGTTTWGNGANTVILNINHNNALGSGLLTCANANTFDNTSGSSVTITNNVNISGNLPTFTGTTNLTINGTYTNGNAGQTLTVSGSTLTLKSMDASATANTFTKSGSGTLAITDAAGANLQGQFTLTTGTLILGHKNAVGSGVFSLNAGTLQASSDLSGANAMPNNALLNANSTVSGSNNITFAGSYLSINAAKTLTSSLDLGKTLTFRGSVTNSGTSAYTLTIAGTGATTFSGGISNGAATAMSLTISSTGMTTLSGTNTYTGTTTINGGILKVNGQTGPADSGTGTNTVTVNAGGALGGNGRVGGGVTIANSTTALLYPNNGVSGGTLTCGSSVTFAGSSAIAKFDLSASVSSGNDKVVLENKTLTCGGATVTINSAGTLATADYTLFDVGASGVIPDSFASTPLWTGTAPANSNQYSITKDTRYVYLHYTAPAGAPVASNDTTTTYANSAVTVNATTNDSNFNPPICQVLSNLLWGGSTVQIVNSTNLFYTPAASSNGTDQFQYVITNSSGSATGTVTVTVLPPAGPTAGNDNGLTTVGNAVTLNVTTNDSNFNPPIYQVLSNVLWGGSTVQIVNSTNLFYTPAASSNGTDQFQYVITNAYGSATGTVTVTVLPPAGPTASNDYAATTVGNAVTLNVTTNDSNFIPPVYQVLSNQLWAGSTVAITGNTNLLYTPASGSNGVDTFQYVITNSSGSATATVSVSVSIPLLAAVSDHAATTMGNAVTINATTNDANFVPPIGSVLSNLMWAGSTVAISSGTNLVYTPAASSNGTDQFQYVITNAYGHAATGTVSVTVTIPPLVASNDTATTIVNGAITINVTTNDLNFVAPIASATPVTWPGSTVVVTNGTNVFYTPAASSNGTDTFKYVITNAYGQSATGTVSVTVSNPAVRNWDGGGSDDGWSTGANWDFDAAPVFPVALTFGGSTRLSPSNDYTSITNNGVVFDATAGAYTIGGNPLTLAGNITNGSANAQTINLSMNLGSSTRTIVGGSAGLTLGGAISGAGGLTLPTSSGTLTLSGNNTNYTGTTTLATGTRLNINHNNALGTGTLAANNQPEIDNTSGSLVTITNTVTPSGTTLTFVGSTNLTINSTFTIPANRTLNVNGSTLTLRSIDAGATTYVFSKGGNGALAIVDAAGAMFQGGFNLNAGTLVLGHKDAIGSGLLTFKGILQASTDLSGTSAITNPVSLAANSTVSGANNITLAGDVTIAQNKTLTSSLALGKTLTVVGRLTNSATAASTFTIAGIGDTTISGPISDGASAGMSLAIDNSGVTVFAGTNSYGGTTAINAGTLRVNGQSGSASGTGTNTVSVNAGGTLGGNGRSASLIVIANTNTAMLYPNHAFAGGTLTCATNVTFSGSNAVAKFDLSGSAVSGNDKVVLENARLACGGATVIINSTGTVDTATDYVLFDVGSGGTISGNFARTPVWAGTAPKYAAGYVVTNAGTTNVVLRYAKIALTVTAQANTKGYDGDTSSVTNPAVTAGTLATGDTGYFTQTYANKHVGSGKTLTPTGTVSNDAAADVTALYTITFTTTNAGTITARPLTVTAVADTKVYDGTTDSTGTPTVVGTMVPGDSATWTQRFDNANVGTGKTLTPTGTVSDANSGSNYAVTFVPTNTGVITAAPLPPTVIDDTAWTPINTPLTIVVAANDSYFDTPIGAVLSNLLWAGSTAVIQDSTNILYTPAANSNGTDTFQYVMTNAFGAATGTVTVTVVPLLTAADDAATTLVNAAITISVTTNDAGFVAPIASVTTLGWGGSSVSVTNGTDVYYTPAANSNGVDTFRYVITNSVGQSATGLVTVTVTAAAASRTWDGGGGDDKWSTAANWDPDVAPVFPVALTFAGATRLTPSNDYVGVTNNSIAFDSSAGAFTLGGNAIRLSGNITNLSAVTQTINMAINLGSTTHNIYGGAGGIVLGGSLSGTGGIELPANSGTVTLSGSNTYSGSTTFRSGTTLNINHANALGSGLLSMLQAGAFDNTSGGAITITNNASLAASSVTFNGTTNLTISGTLTENGTRTINVSGSTLTFARIDAAGFGFTKGGAGTLAIASGTNVQGTVTLNAGTLILGDRSVAGSGLLSLDAGTLQASTDLSGANALENAVTVPNATPPTVSGTNSITFSGAVAIVNSRTLTSSLAAGKTLTFAGSVTNSGTQNSTFTIGGTGATMFSGGIANGTAPSMSLAINNSGVTTFSGTNTYTGTTTVNGGLLRVSGQAGTDSGTGTNTVTVAAGGALGGNGRVGGAVTIANANTAMLYPNNAFAGGTLTCATNVTFGSNSVARFDLSGSAVSGNDKVVLQNARLTCGGATVMINATGMLAAAHYVLFDVGSGGSIVGSFASLPAWVGAPPPGSSRYDVANVGGTNIILHYTPPPGSVYVFR